MASLRWQALNRTAAWLLIVQQALVGAALPCPAAPAKHSAERFPCENCSCGCGTAEQCWRNCCCYTQRQKVAWAREHNVVVPAFVAAVADQEAAAAKPSKPAKCPHCATKEARSDDSAARAHRDRKDEGGNALDVCLIKALRCHGAADFWQAAGASWPGSEPVAWRVALNLTGEIPPIAPIQAILSSPTPPTPPPKLKISV